MLILTRRVGEVVCIGEEITVTVLGVKGNQVRIGVNAPKTTAVHREEIALRIAKENPKPKPYVPVYAPGKSPMQYDELPGKPVIDISNVDIGLLLRDPNHPSDETLEVMRAYIHANPDVIRTTDFGIWLKYHRAAVFDWDKRKNGPRVRG